MKEIHLLIDWGCFFEFDTIKKYLNENSLELENYVKHPQLKNKIEIMSKFYNVHVDDKRGTIDFNIYIINDNNPLYDFRHTNTGKREVNTNLFDLKIQLRSICPTHIHATDNIQETKENLLALDIFDKYYNQKKFKNINEVFETLNNVSSLKWMVMRNFEDFPDNINIDEHLDIDLLVNDYYLIKLVLDATSATPFKTQYENGGNRILNYVYINNIKVLFDFRHLGDNYYDINLQTKMLETREIHKNFYIPCKELHLYSLIYHAIIHKENISSTYVEVFKNYGLKDSEISKEKLKEKLDEFMVTNNYKYVKPEPSVGYFINN
jgi:hypothetical protein